MGTATTSASQAGASIEEKRGRFAEHIARHGLKTTRQRNCVADVFFAQDEHLTIEEMLELVRKQDPKIGYATVYRTLKLLTEAGLAAERKFADGVARYEQALGQKHHDHMVCTECGEVIEFVSDKIEELQDSIAARHGFKLKSHKLELYGICKNCQ
ncbi:MAG: transcriptional repressor [Chrysiogenetes bacterium]|nr:transcriptional repressor [Chrysiogenetes bacterium]